MKSSYVVAGWNWTICARAGSPAAKAARPRASQVLPVPGGPVSTIWPVWSSRSRASSSSGAGSPVSA